jgi:hypothetical protein
VACDSFPGHRLTLNCRVRILIRTRVPIPEVRIILRHPQFANFGIEGR